MVTPNVELRYKGLAGSGRKPAVSQSRLSAGLCCMFKRNLPTGKYKHGWMALEGMSKNLRTLNTQIYTPILDG